MEPIQKTLEEKLKMLPNGKPRGIIKQPDVCSICHGIGYLRVPNPEWRTNHLPVSDIIVCECKKDELNNRIKSLSGLVGSEFDLTWKDIKKTGNVDEAIFAIKAILQRGYGWVYLWGGPGNAKTMLLQIAVAECVRNGKEATYTKFSKVMDNMREAFDKEYPNTEAINRMNRWGSIPVLAIDELDKIRGTEYELTQRLDLLDDRYRDLEQMKSVTLLAANSNPDELMNDYLRSRLEDGRASIIHMLSTDMRPEQKFEMVFEETGEVLERFE